MSSELGKGLLENFFMANSEPGVNSIFSDFDKSPSIAASALGRYINP